MRVTFDPTFPARDDDVHQLGSPLVVAARTVSRSEEDRGLRRADDAHAASRVELRAGGVEEADDDLSTP